MPRIHVMGVLGACLLALGGVPDAAGQESAL